MNKKAARYEYVNMEFRTGKKVDVSRSALFECDWEEIVIDPVEQQDYEDALQAKRAEFLETLAARRSGDETASSGGKKSTTSKKQQLEDEEDREWQRVASTVPRPRRQMRKELDRTAYKHELERVDRAIAEYQKANRELVKDMLESLDPILTTLVEQAPEYEIIMSRKNENAGNALALRNLIISIADGVDVNSGYSVIQNFVGLRQKENTEDGFTRARQKFTETVHQLQKIAPKDLVEMLFNVVFINMVDLTNFPTVRDELGKSPKWPSFDELGDQVARMWKFSRQFPGKEDMKVNISKNGREEDFTGICYNCGKPGHRGRDCTRTKHECMECGGLGHLEKYCFNDGKRSKNTSSKNEDERRRIGSGMKKKHGTANRKSVQFDESTKAAREHGRNKSSGRHTRTHEKRKSDRAKVRARVATSRREHSSDEGDDESVSDDYSDDYGEYEEEVDDEGSVESRVIKILDINEIIQERELRATLACSTTKTNTATTDYLFVVDSGCVGAAHVCNDRQLLSNIRKARITVQGYDGNKTTLSEIGEIEGIGRCVLVDDAPNNLINLLRLAEDINGSYRGNKDSMTIYCQNGDVFVQASKRKGFLTFKLTDIQHSKNPLMDNIKSNEAIITGSIAAASQSSSHLSPMTSTQQQRKIQSLSAQDRARARDAYQLCGLLGHPGINKVKRTLSGPNLQSHLTTFDLDNATLIYGPCPACVEGKMRAPPAKPTTTRSEVYIGEKIYADLLMYDDGIVAIGGYTGELFTKDGQSGYLSVVGLKSKHSQEVEAAFKSTAALYYSNHHPFEHVVFDDEKTFNSCRIALNSLGIKCSATPAGLHNRVAESSIQTFKRSDHATLASLAYVPPSALTLERHRHIIDMLNSVCNARSGGLTAFELFHHRKPFLPSFSWGQPGLFLHTKGKGKDGVPTTSEYGIFVGYKDYNPRNLSAFIPSTGRIVSKRKMQPLQYVPTEWNYPPRSSTSTFAQLTNPQSFLEVMPSAPNHHQNHPFPANSLLEEDSSDDDYDWLLPPIKSQPAPTPQLTPTVQPTQQQPIIPQQRQFPVTSNPMVVPIPAPVVPAPSQPSPHHSSSSIDHRTTTVPLQSPVSMVLPSPAISPAPTVSVLPQEGARQPSAAIAPPPIASPPPQEGGSKIVNPIRESSGKSEEAKKTIMSTRQSAKEGDDYSRKKDKKKESPTKEEVEVSSRGRKRTTYKSYADRQEKIFTYQIEVEMENEIIIDLSFTKEYQNSDPKLQKLTREALDKELKNFVINKCFKGRFKNSIMKEKLWRNVIPAHPVVDDQYNADGSFKQRKVRLVIGGDKQAKETIGETNSPTVNPISMYVVLSLVANRLLEATTTKDNERGYVLSAYDFMSAFLTTEMADYWMKKIIVHIRDRRVVKRLVQLIPELARYVNDDGSIYLDVLRWVYGLAESSRAFFLRIDGILKKIGFVATLQDPCLYVRHTEDGAHYLCLHVDDVLSIAPSIRQRDKLKRELSKEFQLKVQEGAKINYLGLVIQIDYKKKKISVTQSGFVQELINKFLGGDKAKGRGNKIKTVKTPASLSLFDREDDKQEKCDQKKYLSIVMSLMFLARMTRVDILLPVTYLATKSSSPTVAHYKKTLRILKYIKQTSNHGLVFRGNGDSSMIPEVKVYADASHLTHNDGKGHSGILITINGTVVMSRSVKQKSAARSSTEAELIALEEATTYVKWIRELIWTLIGNNDKRRRNTIGKMARFLNTPTIVYQDNKSAIHMATNPSKFSRTKHMLGKLAYIRDRIAKGDIKLTYLPTGIMLADILTKPMSEKQILNLIRRMGLEKIDTTQQ